MSFWIGVLVIAVGLLISIALHELGHLLPAKRFGVRVPQYFVGFGPTLWSRTRGETEYGVKAIPLGGFVRMVGMFPPGKHAGSAEAADEDRLRRRGIGGWAQSVTEDARAASMEELQPGDDKRAFYQLSTPKKLAVMFGGPFVNLVLAVLLLGIVVSGFGVFVSTSTLSTVTECVTPTGDDGECASSDATSPAADAGLLPGDVVVSWGGVAVEDWEDVSAAIRTGGTDPVSVEVERDGAPQSLTVTPVLTDRPVYDELGRPVVEDGSPVLESIPYVGISPTAEREQLPVTAVPAIVGDGVVRTVGVVLTLPQRLVAIASSLGGGERDPNVIGIVGIGRAAGELTEATADDGLVSQVSIWLNLLASLNLALFVFNMIPLPPFDGGHIAGALYEGARRQIARLTNRPNPGYADTAKLMPLTYVIFIALVGMSLLLAVADIVNPVRFT